ncbi:hypothetical protein CHGG_04053 [Chaetomium globosum CBS 148.51]|uniref:Uncharacterized protein n=1 Tax=Chaetomium globosum (strain ATCC 6205 / CBS 148.51 / DSM 1962 / NBRC 6347 / NRRL 1970) TaxID=306901 RepID=Q2H2E3_CHAGB|nr:uncharacterized protein CHGG_04053 [Chaetomium globosum CBS 148.51]EAQ87434.1 hypothetical protein CHGG_04053 [Chaetomium globosum CBS 148.51]
MGRHPPPRLAPTSPPPPLPRHPRRLHPHLRPDGPIPRLPRPHLPRHARAGSAKCAKRPPSPSPAFPSPSPGPACPPPPPTPCHLTLLLIDPDAPTPDDPKFAYWRHWVVTGIPAPSAGSEGGGIEGGRTLTGYSGAGPQVTSPGRTAICFCCLPSRRGRGRRGGLEKGDSSFSAWSALSQELGSASIDSVSGCAAVVSTTNVCSTCVTMECVAPATITAGCGSCDETPPTIYRSFPCDQGCDNIGCKTVFSVETATDGECASGASPTPTPSPDPNQSTGGGGPTTSASTAGAARAMPFRLWDDSADHVRMTEPEPGPGAGTFLDGWNLTPQLPNKLAIKSFLTPTQPEGRQPHVQFHKANTDGHRWILEAITKTTSPAKMISSLSLIVLPALAVVAGAFGTINDPIVLKQHNEHEMITRLAFQCPDDQKSDGICFEPGSLDQLAGYHINVLGIALTGTGTNGAVGAPDTFDPLPEGPEAHCDDADYLDIPGYPQSRAQANAKLQTCVDHLRHRFRQAVGAARRMLDERNRVRREMVQLYSGDCTFAFPGWQSDDFGRAKCSTLEGLGRALHGIQDFYAHSNWADDADPTQPISVANPPGLGMNGTASFLDLRANGTIPPDQIPRNLTTGGLELGIAVTIRAQPETYDDRGAIVLFATSAEDPESIDNTLEQLRRAAEEGIRVHYACIDMHTNTAEVIPDKAKWAGCTPGDSLVPPVLKTGGIVAFVDGPAARLPAHFANLVMDNGLTATDEDEQTPEHTRIYPGIALAGFLSPDRPTKSFTYPLSVGEKLEFTVSSVAANGQGTEACFSVTLWRNYPDKEIATHTRCGDSSPLSLRYEATESFDLVLEAEYSDTAPKDELLGREDILFVLGVDTNMPEKDETTVRTTTSIRSARATVGGEALLSSETVEVVSGTATVDNSTSTSTWTESYRVAYDDSASSFLFPGIEYYPMCAVPTVTATTMVSNLTVGREEDGR